MTVFDYQGDLEGLNNIHLDFINKFLTERGFKPAVVQVEQVGSLGDNYQSTVKRIIIEDFRMIAKIAINHELLRVKIKTKQHFNNEMVLYSKVLPKYAEMLKEVGLTDRLKMPEYYGCFTEEPNEIILLEDLTASGYKILNRLEPLPVEAVDKVLQDFATFHALSYVLKTRDRELFKSFSRELKSPWGDIDEMFEASMTIMEGEVVKQLDAEEYKEKVRGLLEKQSELSARLEAEDVEQSDCTVIVQGDAWTNNLMFKYEDGKLKSLMMIDYQLSRESNPVLDLTYMLNNCTEHAARAQHWQRWLGLYHAELRRVASLFGVDAGRFLSRDRLDGSLRRYARPALAIALMFNAFVLKESEEVFDFTTEFENKPEIQEVDLLDWAKPKKMNDRSALRLKERLNGLCQSFKEFGYFEDDVWNLS